MNGLSALFLEEKKALKTIPLKVKKIDAAQFFKIVWLIRDVIDMLDEHVLAKNSS